MGKDNYWKDKNVVVTGCTGILGSWLTKALLDKGANVIGLIRDWVPKSNLILLGCSDKIITVRGEVENYFLLERIINEYEVETVFHLAAQTIVGIANSNPLSTFETNIKGTWNVLEACRKSSSCAKVVVASSDKAYGCHEALPYTEKTFLRGSHPYDVSKSCADLLALTYHNTYKLPVCITRCGNFYGGGDLNFNRIVPGTIRSAINGQRPIIRSDGQFVRDYIYVLDAVNAYLCLAEAMDKKDICGEAFNFSNEVQLTVSDVVKKILKILNREDLKPVVLNKACGEIRHQYLSAQKARELLGWKPKYSVEEGLAETVNWYVDFFKR